MAEAELTTIKNRIEIIDILRGFALVGILYAHMVIWYTGASIPQEVYFKYNSIADSLAMAIFGSLVFGKFFSVFSFLFGLSFYLHFRRKQINSSYLKTYLWRLFLLLLIGLAHHIIWRGDILAIYAFLGSLLIIFRHLPENVILLISLLLITNLPTHIYDLFHQTSTSEVTLPMAEEAENYYSLVNKGDFLTVLKENWDSWPAKIRYQLESGRLLMTFGYFLLGLYAGKRKVFSNIKDYLSHFIKWNKVTGRAVLFLLLIGLLMYLFDYVSLPEIEVIPQWQWIASFLFSIYNACLTIFYISGITLLFQKEVFRRILKPLGAMGRMALTNYLLQTVFGLLIFYNFGFALFDKTSPAENVLLGIVVFYLQLKFSQLWLRHFKQGPVEWVWKGFTYLRFTSNKIRTRESSSAGAQK